MATNTLATDAAHDTGANNRLLSDGAYEYEYDAEGNRVKRTHIASGDYTEYDWDHRNRLIRDTERDDTNATLQVVDQVYDTFNRWIGRYVDTTSPFDMFDAEETHFIYDGNQIILQFDDADLTHRYLWGPAVDQILADEQYDPSDPDHDDPATEEGTTLWPLTDHLHTVRDIAQHDATSGVALLVNHLQYNSFGLVTYETDTTIDLLFLFTARPYDETTGLQNNHHPWYDILVGAWISEDPIGFDGLDPNLHGYVFNQPTFRTDPSGQVPPLLLAGAFGVAVAIDWIWPDAAAAPANDGDVAAAQTLTQQNRDNRAVATAVTVAAAVAGPVVVAENTVARITFGHGARHLICTRLTAARVEAAIIAHINSLGVGVGTSWGWVQVNGYWIQYRLHVLADGTRNVGTYFPVQGPFTTK